MVVFNRNIITEQDIANFRDENFPGPVTLDVNPPAGAIASPAGQPLTPLRTPTADDFLTVLLKYVPVEVVGVYLFIESILNQIDQNWKEWALLALVIVFALIALPVYMRNTLNICRVQQIILGSVGMVVYVLAFGGWFATQDWYQAAYGSIGLAVYAFIVKVVKLPPLPPSS